MYMYVYSCWLRFKASYIITMIGKIKERNEVNAQQQLHRNPAESRKTVWYLEIPATHLNCILSKHEKTYHHHHHHYKEKTTENNNNKNGEKH